MPRVENLPDTGLRGQFCFLKSPAPWLILGATLLGNGGTFAWYSYVTPLLTNSAGFPARMTTFLMVLAGFGMVVGNLAGGRLSDRFSPGRVAAFAQGMICVALLFIFFFAHISWLAVGLMCLCTAGLFAVSSPQQVLLIRYSKEEMLGAASVQVAFNLEMRSVLMLGITFASWNELLLPSISRCAFCICRCLLLVTFFRKYERRTI